MSTIKGIKRVSLTVQQRLDVLKKLEEGVRLNTICKEYNISLSTVHRIHRNATQLRQQSMEKRTRFLKRIRKPVLHELDTRLYTWFLERKTKGDVITDAILREKAIELNAEFDGPSTFTASKGWMWRFKLRHSIRLLKLHEETEDVEQEKMEEFSEKFLKLLNHENLQLDNIYNMDETVLLWKALPQKMLSCLEDKMLYGYKLKKERVTVAFCANATGTHKLMPLFVHKFENPRALKHCRDLLPVVYKTNKYARMTRTLFADWLENYFKPAVMMHQLKKGEIPGKVMLLVDSCLAHTLPPELETKDDKLEVVFLPSTTSTLQPMDQGIVAKVKASFRHRMLCKILSYHQRVADFYQDYDIKDCIDFITDSWAEVTEDNIKDSWKKLLLPALPEGEQGDCSFESSTVDAMRKTLCTIAGKEVSEEEVEEWLSTCEENEDISHADSDEEEDDAATQKDEEEEEKENEPESKRKRLSLTEEETKTLFEHLEIWVQSKPAYLQGFAIALKRYYDHERIVEKESTGNEGG